ncbi:transmembrane protein 88 isoform X2 [Saccopteryx leptura]|uniref:transmembrane protein 88 isoform X2 n=1 Tax=Saccopteryx leptura TaxID=249018 RepID=UPI00339BCF05
MADVLGAQRPVPSSGPEPRDPLDCWACAVLVTAQNLLVAAFNLLLLALVLGTILLPAVTMLGFGFLCHSQPSSLPAPAWPTAPANPGLTRVPSRPHLRKGMGLRTLLSRTTPTTALPFSRPKHPLVDGITCGPNASENSPHPGKPFLFTTRI